MDLLIKTIWHTPLSTQHAKKGRTAHFRAKNGSNRILTRETGFFDALKLRKCSGSLRGLLYIKLQMVLVGFWERFIKEVFFIFKSYLFLNIMQYILVSNMERVPQVIRNEINNLTSTRNLYTGARSVGGQSLLSQQGRSHPDSCPRSVER